MKIKTLDQAEAATKAAQSFYHSCIIEAVEDNISERELSRRLGKSENYITNALKKGKFSSLRRIANLCSKLKP